MEELITRLAGRVARWMVGLGAVVALATGAPAQAQTRAALVKNIDEPGRTPYQSVIEFNAGDGCTSNICNFVSFTPVPAGKRLVVDHLSAMVGVTGGGRPAVTAFSTSLCTNCNNRALIAGWVDTGFTPVSGVNFWILDRPLTVYFEAGETPRLKMIATTNFSVVGNASLVGHLIDATN